MNIFEMNFVEKMDVIAHFVLCICIMDAWAFIAGNHGSLVASQNYLKYITFANGISSYTKAVSCLLVCAIKPASTSEHSKT